MVKWRSYTKVLTGINLVSHEYGIVIPKSKAGNIVKDSKSDGGYAIATYNFAAILWSILNVLILTECSITLSNESSHDVAERRDVRLV